MKQTLKEILKPLWTVCIIVAFTLIIFDTQPKLALALSLVGFVCILADVWFNQSKIKFEKVSFEQYSDAIGGDAGRISSIKLLSEYNDIKIPQRATQGSAGYDIFSPCSFTLEVGETIKLPTGIRVKIENTNKFLMIVPRSSLGFKYRMQLDNTCGVVDRDYAYSDNEGLIYIKLTNDGKEGKVIEINKGDAIAQGIFIDYGLTKDDNVKTVRNGGFGSTNRGVNK